MTTTRVRRLEALVFSIATAVALVHALDDAFVHRQPGVGLGQHALAAAAALLVGLGLLLLLFSPAFGIWHIPIFFQPHSYTSPLGSPWNWFRGLVVPSLVVGAPLGALCLRLTLALTREASARASSRRPRRRACPMDASSDATPRRWPTPRSRRSSGHDPRRRHEPGPRRVGLLRARVLPKRALAQAAPPTVDVPTLQALALWAALLIVVMSMLSDIALTWLDPRLMTGRPPG